MLKQEQQQEKKMKINIFMFFLYYYFSNILKINYSKKTFIYYKTFLTSFPFFFVIFSAIERYISCDFNSI
jgi:hypothetical protein